MRWMFMWQDLYLNMHYEVHSCATKEKAEERFRKRHPRDFVFAVIGGNDFDVEEFHS